MKKIFYYCIITCTLLTSFTHTMENTPPLNPELEDISDSIDSAFFTVLFLLNADLIAKIGVSLCEWISGSE